MALAEELAGEKGVYTTHLRSEFEPILDAPDEAFRIGRHGKVPVVVSHHKCAGAKNWGRTKETLAFFDQMRQHREIGCDVYPYSASSSTLDLKQVTDEFDIVITVTNTSAAGRENTGANRHRLADEYAGGREAANACRGYLLQHGRARRPPSVELSGQYDWL